MPLACPFGRGAAGNGSRWRDDAHENAPDRSTWSGAVLTAHRAEAVGFEPTVTSLPRRLSRLPESRAVVGPSEGSRQQQTTTGANHVPTGQTRCGGYRRWCPYAKAS
jgi:hypothetical protein